MGFKSGCALVLACLALAGEAVAQGDPSVVLPVLVYNYAKVPAGTLRAAQRHAERMFQDTAVQFEWHECRVSRSEPQRDTYCSRGLRRTDLVLKVLPQSRIQAFAVGKDVAGLVPEGEMVSDAFVFYDRLRDIARRESADAAVLLGTVIAHEFGHLLTGSADHSDGGLMRAEWTVGSLARSSQGETQFSAEQHRQIHLGALARSRRAEGHSLAQSLTAP